MGIKKKNSITIRCQNLNLAQALAKKRLQSREILVKTIFSVPGKPGYRDYTFKRF
jgi:hypothetical protein